MQSRGHSDIETGDAEFLGHPEKGCVISHYFRQIVISRRRQDPRINRSWSRNRKLPPRTVWTP